MESEEERLGDSAPVSRSDQRTCQPRPPWMPVGETREAAQDEQRDSEERSRALTRKNIQVVMAIAMPRPRRILPSPSSKIHRDQEVFMNYSIGMHTTTWEDGV